MTVFLEIAFQLGEQWPDIVLSLWNMVLSVPEIQVMLWWLFGARPGPQTQGQHQCLFNSGSLKDLVEPGGFMLLGLTWIMHYMF